MDIVGDPPSRTTHPRCCAKTRSGGTCKNVCTRRPDGTYRPRCYYHGGAPGSGAPKGNQNSMGKQNALKTGEYTRSALARYKRLRQEIKAVQDLLKAIKGRDPAAWGMPGIGVLFPGF